MNIIFVGLSGVPCLRRACDVRLMAFANAYIKIGYNVYIFNRHPVKKTEEIKLDQPYNENIQFIEVINKDKPENRALYIFVRLISYIIEFCKISKFNRKVKINFIQVYSWHYFEFVLYKFLAKVIHAKIIYQYVEFTSEIKR